MYCCLGTPHGFSKPPHTPPAALLPSPAPLPSSKSIKPEMRIPCTLQSHGQFFCKMGSPRVKPHHSPRSCSLALRGHLLLLPARGTEAQRGGLSTALGHLILLVPNRPLLVAHPLSGRAAQENRAHRAAPCPPLTKAEHGARHARHRTGPCAPSSQEGPCPSSAPFTGGGGGSHHGLRKPPASTGGVLHGHRDKVSSMDSILILSAQRQGHGQP